MTYIDQELEVSKAQDCSSGTTTLSTKTIDLNVSPDMGLGKQLMAHVQLVNTFTPATMVTLRIEIVTDDQPDLSGSPKIIGVTPEIPIADLDPGVDFPIIVRMDPLTAADLDVDGVNDRYLGLRYVANASPTAMDITASFIECIQANPTAAHHKSGFVVN